MKTCLLLALALGLAGCSKNTPNPEPTPYSISWTDDGRETTAYEYMSGTGRSTDLTSTVLVGGRVRQGGIITTDLQLDVPPAVGTYVLGASPAWLTYKVGTGSYYAGLVYGGKVPSLPTVAVGSGRVTVTELTEQTISGTFSFTSVDPTANATRTVTNGKFYVRK